jgi:glutamate-ammonia-ligase adenylyltransferase
VHRPRDGADESAATAAANAVAHTLRRLLGEPAPDPAFEVDADLRPEGKAGPLVRTVESYEAYYSKWSAVWEAQALLRAEAVVGDEGVCRRYMDLVDRLRFPDEGLSFDDVREIRRIKARVDNERLPRGADRKTHLKLGRGGLGDIEWTVQLLQMRHAHAVPTLRTTSTLPALEAAETAGLITADHAAALRDAWSFASRLRNAAVLYRGKAVDSVPSDLRVADGVSRILGGEPGSGADLAEDYRRTARHARTVTEFNFYGST